MNMTPERITERVEDLIKSIRTSASHDYASDNATQTLAYVSQLFEMGLINQAQFDAVVAAVEQASVDWRPPRRSYGSY